MRKGVELRAFSVGILYTSRSFRMLGKHAHHVTLYILTNVFLSGTSLA
jgi:hypothetical protein